MITLQGLLSVIDSDKIITVNLFDENDLLLISFGLPGWQSLDDFLCDDEVIKVKINNLTNLDVKIDTSGN